MSVTDGIITSVTDLLDVTKVTFHADLRFSSNIVCDFFVCFLLKQFGRWKQLKVGKLDVTDNGYKA